MRLFSSILVFCIGAMLAAVPVYAAASEEHTTVEAATEKAGSDKAAQDKTAQDQPAKKETSSIQVKSTERGLVISWPAVPEADNYMLYRSEEGGKLEEVILAGPGENKPAADNASQKADVQNSSNPDNSGQSTTAPGEPVQSPDAVKPADPKEEKVKYPLPAVADPLQTITDSKGNVTGYTYTDSLILPGKAYHYYIKTYHKKSDSWNYYDREGAEGTWNITPLQIRAGTQLTEDAVRQLGEDTFFAVQEISEQLFQERLYGKSYKEYCDIPLENLRYIRCLHRDIDGNIKVGELVMNTKCADSVCEIFHELYRQSYPIESMLLVDDFNASDEDSIYHNNTSAFNYRTVDNTAELSNHAFGLAIDINPYYNVYYIPSQNYVFPPEGREYLNREADFPYKLAEGDLCYNLFINAGFSWGGYFTYNTDYQHFYMDP